VKESREIIGAEGPKNGRQRGFLPYGVQREKRVLRCYQRGFVVTEHKMKDHFWGGPSKGMGWREEK